MAATPHDSSGTTVTFAGTSYTVTGITYSRSNTEAGGDTIDISHLGLTTGASVLTQTRPLAGTANGETGKEIQIEYIGTNAIAGGATGSLVITGGISISANATCMSSSVTLAVNDVIRGSATFRVA